MIWHSVFVQSLPVHVQQPLSSFDPDGASFSFFEGHLRRLRALPAHGNRVLHLHQLFVALLLSFYNPAVRSLRLIEDNGDFDGRLDLKGIDRLARSTTSDALATFDPVHLKPIIADLHRRVGQIRKTDDALAGITQRIIAGDGTYMNTFADVAWALHHTKSNGRRQGQVRLNVQLDTQAWTPQVISVSGDDGSEPEAFTADLLRDVLYVLDRNFLDFGFLDRLIERDNQVVLRARANAPATRVVLELPLAAADREAGVASDQLVTLTGRDAPRGGPWRLVVIHATNRKGELEVIRLLTSLTDAAAISAATIGEVYRKRWQIELFFKWLKTWAGLDHLLSTRRNGITFQFYVAVIAVLLMYVQLGRRVSRYALVQLQLLMHGQVTLSQMMKTLARRERERTLAHARAEKRRATKKLV